MEWTLDQMPLGQEAVVLQIEENSMLEPADAGNGNHGRVRICRKRQAPLGDPSVYMVRGSALAIRNMDAAHILVRPVHISVAGGFINRRKER